MGHEHADGCLLIVLTRVPSRWRSRELFWRASQRDVTNTRALAGASVLDPSQPPSGIRESPCFHAPTLLHFVSSPRKLRKIALVLKSKSSIKALAGTSALWNWELATPKLTRSFLLNPSRYAFPKGGWLALHPYLLCFDVWHLPPSGRFQPRISASGLCVTSLPLLFLFCSSLAKSALCAS